MLPDRALGRGESGSSRDCDQNCDCTTDVGVLLWAWMVTRWLVLVWEYICASMLRILCVSLCSDSWQGMRPKLGAVSHVPETYRSALITDEPLLRPQAE